MPQPDQRAAYKTFINLCLLFSSVMFSLLVLELYFRVLDPQSIIPRYVETSPHGIRKNIANVRGAMIVPEYSHQFNTNSQGFRGTSEYAVAKPPGVYRIIVLGDSVALGHGVEEQDAFASVLERTLSSIQPTEVINMGVSGFGTAEELIQLRTVGLSYNPDLVILAYFQNDPYNNVVSKLFAVTNGKLTQAEQTFVPAIYLRDRLYAIPGYSFLCQHSHLVNFIRNRFSGYFIERLARQNQISAQTSSTLSPDEAELTGLLLAEMMTELHTHRLPFIILNIPLIFKGEIISNLPVDRLGSINSSVHVVHAMQEIYGNHTLKDLSYEKDSHPKALAHKLIGEWLGSYIQKKIWAIP